MLLTVSKRLEFSASRRLFDPALSEAENRSALWRGERRALRHGPQLRRLLHLFREASIAATGMLMNISEIKSRVNEVLDAGFDHKFLNEDNPAFADMRADGGERGAPALGGRGAALP